ncbi:MAG: efflux RND transporter periplasmic adaptor subunit [Rickettsiaceae bacterium]|nr:efflux RND transporter periplasmic adaptor subunit [Rickettsiaceae bacterium]MDP4832186.1 efflux RND transporter periplasmic adaptor subunit [Rickettsiaceae bacterium]MDP5020432.1 efflux RND transporter periplasmic adaptor subunit [Rickettsiaceae bacterium]MDP5083071.1 efflux RND transporter periplasmic adaptor subunit [Rickettsiaceae bacterium]
MAVLISFTNFHVQASENQILVLPIKIGYYDFHEKFTAIGQCKSEQSKTYYAKTTGSIDSISIIQGKNVSANDILITINADIAEANKSKAEASFQSAQTTYERDVSLLKKKIISSEVSNKSKVALEIARSDLVNTLSQYEDMIITAPYDGYVGVVNARTGDDVKVGDYLFSLIAQGDKTIFIELPENMHAKIDQNSLIYATDSDNKKIQGRVIAVSNYLNDNGTITAKLAFDPDSKLVHGSYVEVEIIFDQHKAVAVPEKILLKNNQGNFVYKITEDNKSQQVYIVTGARTDNMIEVLSGEIQAGNLLVLSGLTKVYDGAMIEIINETADTQTKNDA